jgi:hypothetical protein
MANEILQCIINAQDKRTVAKENLNREVHTTIRSSNEMINKNRPADWLNDYYNTDADAKLFNKYFSLNGIKEQFIENLGMEGIEAIVKFAVTEVGLLIGVVGSIDQGVSFILKGKASIGSAFKILDVIDIIYTAFIDKKFIPKAGDELWDYYWKLNDEKNKINNELKKLISQYKSSQDNKLRAQIISDIREYMALRKLVLKTQEEYGQWVDKMYSTQKK